MILKECWKHDYTNSPSAIEYKQYNHSKCVADGIFYFVYSEPIKKYGNIYTYTAFVDFFSGKFNIDLLSKKIKKYKIKKIVFEKIKVLKNGNVSHLGILKEYDI